MENQSITQTEYIEPLEARDERYIRNRELILKAQMGEESATETLIVENVALVKSGGGKFRDRGTEFEDLMQIGTIGMIKAIRSFDIERGTVFSTYAVPLIIGEIKRFMRDNGEIKVSRVIKTQYRQISKFIEELNDDDYVIFVDCHI